MRGGYQPSSRLAGNGDEIVITLMEMVRARTHEEQARAFKEAVELTRERLSLLAQRDGPQPPVGMASA